jgi:hypothetical protein
MGTVDRQDQRHHGSNNSRRRSRQTKVMKPA